MSDVYLFVDKFYIDHTERGFSIKFVKEKSDTLDQPELPQGHNFGMSPFTAKELLSVLYLAVAEYEREHGTINLDEANIKQVQRVIKQHREPIGFRNKAQEREKGKK